MQLNLIEGFDLLQWGPNSAESLHVITECIKLAKADIYHFVADPRFAHIPLEGMISKEYAERRRSAIDRQRAMVYPDHGDPPGSRRVSLRYPAGSTVEDAAVASASRDPSLQPCFPERAYEGCTTSFSVADASGVSVGTSEG